MLQGHIFRGCVPDVTALKYRLYFLYSLLQGLFAQRLADLGQGLALSVTELDTTLDMVAENAIFGDQAIPLRVFHIKLSLSMGDGGEEDKPRVG